jgi:hypothetical protein
LDPDFVILSFDREFVDRVIAGRKLIENTDFIAIETGLAPYYTFLIKDGAQGGGLVEFGPKYEVLCCEVSISAYVSNVRFNFPLIDSCEKGWCDTTIENLVAHMDMAEAVLGPLQ